MNVYDDLIEEILSGTVMAPMPQREREARSVLLGRLFEKYTKDPDTGRFDRYFEETAAIPLDKLSAALTAIAHSRLWPSLPQTGEIWVAAKQIAGMHREQYRHGRYIRAATKWPPPGQSHAIQLGQLEPVKVPQLAGPEKLKQLAEGA